MQIRKQILKEFYLEIIQQQPLTYWWVNTLPDALYKETMELFNRWDDMTKQKNKLLVI